MFDEILFGPKATKLWLHSLGVSNWDKGEPQMNWTCNYSKLYFAGYHDTLHARRKGLLQKTNDFQ